MTLTSGSLNSTSKPARTFASVAPPPPSRKLAGWHQPLIAPDDRTHSTTSHRESVHRAHSHPCSIPKRAYITSFVSLTFMVEQPRQTSLPLQRVSLRLLCNLLKGVLVVEGKVVGDDYEV